MLTSVVCNDKLIESKKEKNQEKIYRLITVKQELTC